MIESRKIMDQDILDYYAQSKVLEHYEEATVRVGLWDSEKIVFTMNLPDFSKSILELGCGCGRIAFGLSTLGYSKVKATDFSKIMLKRARAIAKRKNISVPISFADARNLPFDSESVEGIIFGFNGLMQIPGRTDRMTALKEIKRVLVPGGKFIFTTHDRGMTKWKKFWQTERKRWRKNQQGAKLHEFGDRFEQTHRGKLYLHVPEIQDVKDDLNTAGLLLEWEKMRSSIIEERSQVKQYSDNCRFWVARKPDKVLKQ